MDALSDVLRVVRLTGGVFLDAKFTAPWSVAGRVEPEEIRGFVERPCHVIGFHYVVAGRMVARVAGCDPVEVKAGEIVLLTRNDTHILASALEISPISAEPSLAKALASGTLEYGGGGAETRMVCGYLGSDCLDNPVVASLPPMLTLNVAATPGGAWIAQSFAFAAQQLAEGAVGASTIISKLSELMFVEAVRRHIEHLPPEQTGWLAGLRDPAVGKALALLHTEPSARLDGRGPRRRRAPFAFGLCGALHRPARPAADEVSHRLADAACRTQAAREPGDGGADRL
jgi:hypothetical protein